MCNRKNRITDRDAEDPPVKRRISKPASQWQSKKRGEKKKTAEIKHRTEQTDQTPRKRSAEVTKRPERREQEAELEQVQHAPTQTEQEEAELNPENKNKS